MEKRAHSRLENAPRVPQLFVEDDGPVSFYLMDRKDQRNISVYLRPLSENRVSTLTKLIERHGGVVHDNIDESRVIIVNEEAVENYSRFYRFSPRVDVEPPGFISKCINDNAYGHWRPPPRAMGGRPHNPERLPQERRGFTAQEDQFLAKYIARRIPNKAAGGRMGNKIYKELEEHAAEFDTGPYVMGRNHTWHSWRERYKKNPERFDEMIEKILAQDTRPPDAKVIYPMDRRLSTRHLVAQTRLDESDAESEGSQTDEDGIESDEQPRGRKRPRRYSRDQTYEPPHKRARNQEEEDDSLDEAYASYEPEVADRSNVEYRDENGAGPSGTQRTPSRSPSPPHSADEEPSREAEESVAANNRKPKPRPIRSKRNVVPDTQSTLVNPTQQHSRKRPSVLQGRESFEYGEDREENLESDGELEAVQQEQRSPASRSNVRPSPRKLVEVLVPRIRDIRRLSLPQAEQQPRASVPPIATLPQPFTGTEDNELEVGDEATEEEIDQLDPSLAHPATSPDVEEDDGSDIPQEDDTIIGDELAGQRTEGENVEAVEDEESGADSDDEIDMILGVPNDKGYESESDLKAERNLRNAEMDMATPPPPAPVLRRSGRNKK